MPIWNQAPLVRLFIPFLSGILTAVCYPCVITNLFSFSLFLLFIIFLIVLVPFFRISYRKSWWFGLLMNVTMFLFAYGLTIQQTEKFDSTHFSKWVQPKSIMYVRVIQPSIEKEKSLKLQVEVIAVKDSEKWTNTIGKAVVYLKKDKLSLNIKYGDELFLIGSFMEVPLPQNPAEFNYQQFLAFHNVYHQAFISKSNWLFAGKNSGNLILKFSYYLRQNLLIVLSNCNLKEDEYSVGAALMLGYTDKLDADIISAYSSTGALHVLSVSGLHVAIVYVVFNYFLFFLEKLKYGNIIKAFILILLLWLYAAITGLSPSVLRAATMFSFIIFAKVFNRYTNIYNTLAASAFLLLVINPYLIMDVGFQLSYIAVIGIVYIQPKIYNWFEPKFWLLDQIWTITAVSIAAQIATFPLGLFYFHQFPNYFLISNFIVIPVSTIVLYLGICLFAFSKIPFLVLWIATGFNWAVWLLNYSVKMIEHWPFALIGGISISIFETCMIYVGMILFFFFFVQRKYIYLFLAFTCIIVILGSQIAEQTQQYHQKKIIIYNIPKTSAIDFIYAKSNVLYADSSFIKNESGLLFHVKHFWWELGLTHSNFVCNKYVTSCLNIQKNHTQFYDKTIVIVNGKTNLLKKMNPDFIPVNVDLLIISQNAKIKIIDLIKMYKPTQIVFDSSNSIYKIKAWAKECANLRKDYYSVQEKGALEISL